jgi:hypothetical protein
MAGMDEREELSEALAAALYAMGELGMPQGLCDVLADRISPVIGSGLSVEDLNALLSGDLDMIEEMLRRRLSR